MNIEWIGRSLEDGTRAALKLADDSRIRLAEVSSSKDTRGNYQLDKSEIASLINRAFAVEHVFREGDRIGLQELQPMLKRGTFCVARDGAVLVGCIYVEIGNGIGQIGLLSVEPTRQKSGIGSLLMERAEQLCRTEGCAAIRLRVINLRAELIPFYLHKGFQITGTEPAPMIKTKNCSDVHFVVLSKSTS